MKPLLVPVWGVALITIAACQPKKQPPAAGKPSQSQSNSVTRHNPVEPKGRKTKISYSNLTWVDSLIVGYMEHSQNEFFQFARKQKINPQWMLDTQTRDNKIYIIAEIGQDMEYRFVPQAWIYIDTLTRSLYEYDLQDDTLLKWSR
jgi:hypothetical protein